MAHVVAPNFRGKGKSATKVTKAGEPKRSGNWSASTIRYQTMQSKDYCVYAQGGKWIVGDHTPLDELMPGMTEILKNDPYFASYHQEGVHTHGCKQYEAHKTLTMCKHTSWRLYSLVYRETIYTMGDFEYNFPEY